MSAQHTQSRLSVFPGALPQEADKDALQTGYKYGWSGYLLFSAWATVVVSAQLLMGALVLADLDFGPNNIFLAFVGPEKAYAWESVSEPFLLIYIGSALFIFVLLKYNRNFYASLFLRPCPLNDAEKVMITHGSHTVLCDVRREGPSPPCFDFLCFRYVFDQGRFRPVGVLPELSGVDVQARSNPPTGVSEQEVERLLTDVGPNEVRIEVPSVLGALFSEFSSPLYVFQFYCCWMYLFAHVWNVGIAWLTLVIVSGVVKSIFITRRNMLKLQAMALLSDTVQVVRNGRLISQSSELLVPGDLILVQPNKTAPCDCLLAQGGAVVDEAMLTGEPMPVTKLALDASLQKSTKQNMIYGGTSVLDASGFGSEDGALAIVTAVGGASVRANLLRLVLFPTDVHFEWSKDISSVFIILALYAFGLAAVLVAQQSYGKNVEIRNMDGRLLTNFEMKTGMLAGLAALMVKCIFSITQCINPLLPVSFSMGQSMSSSRLGSTGLMCLAPERVPMAGVIDTMVLDKTGTITQEGMELHAVQSCTGSALSTDVCIADELDTSLPQLLRYLIASCHKVSRLQDQLIGNVVEVEMFKALGSWTLESTLNSKERVIRSGCERLEVLRLLEFDHVRMTSGVVVRIPSGETYVFWKGAASRINDLCANVPADFLNTANGYSFECFYVLGCAGKKVEPSAVSQSRDELESGLTAMGMLLFKNEVKHDSAAALAELSHGGIRSVMCTGDHLLTACSVGKATGMIPVGAMILKAKGEKHELSWEDMDTGDRYEVSELATLPSISLVVEQTEFDMLRESPDFRMLLPTIAIYARMVPEGKVAVVEELQKSGHYVGMCGDGGNDCGALRSAHVGLALSAADSSIVSPFSSGQNKSLFRLGELVKEGRACLCNNLACYCFFINYGIGITMAKVSLLVMNSMMLSEWQYLYFDIFICLSMPWAMTYCRPASTLSPFRPSSSLLNIRVISCCVGMHVIFFISMGIAYGFLSQQPFYIPWFPGLVNVRDNELHKLSDNFESPVVFICFAVHLATMGIVYCNGGNHRAPVWKNVRLLGVYCTVIAGLLIALFTQRTGYNCLLRVNCDS
jgi:cation-transporting ATPase 13A3/4/5